MPSRRQSVSLTKPTAQPRPFSLNCQVPLLGVGRVASPARRNEARLIEQLVAVPPFAQACPASLTDWSDIDLNVQWSVPLMRRRPANRLACGMNAVAIAEAAECWRTGSGETKWALSCSIAVAR
jgi:hypothetical protein